MRKIVGALSLIAFLMIFEVLPFQENPQANLFIFLFPKANYVTYLLVALPFLLLSILPLKFEQALTIVGLVISFYFLPLEISMMWLTLFIPFCLYHLWIRNAYVFVASTFLAIIWDLGAAMNALRLGIRTIGEPYWISVPPYFAIAFDVLLLCILAILTFLIPKYRALLTKYGIETKLA